MNNEKNNERSNGSRSELRISEIIRASLDSIRSIAGVDTVIGNPINCPGGTTVIPVCKVSLGLASGGLDYYSRDKGVANANTGASGKAYPSFGGGGGTGLSVTPLAFLVISSEGEVELLSISNPTSPGPTPDKLEAIGDLAERVPDIVDNFKSVFSKGSGKGISDKSAVKADTAGKPASDDPDTSSEKDKNTK